MKQPTPLQSAKLGAVSLTFLGFLLLVALQAQWFPARAEEPVLAEDAIEQLPSPTPVVDSNKSEEVMEEERVETKVATITAYSCGGLNTPEEIQMNCPSLWTHGVPTTATGTTPIPYKTMACDRANLGRVFEVEGYGEVECTDTGGAIKGPGRFDLYVKTVDEARQFGVQNREYKLK